MIGIFTVNDDAGSFPGTSPDNDVRNALINRLKEKQI
jgi:hypothetical protein